MSRGNQSSLRNPEYQLLIGMLQEVWLASNQTQKQICDALGRPKNYLIKIAKGERRIDVLELMQLCDVLSVDPLEILQQYRKRLAKG